MARRNQERPPTSSPGKKSRREKRCKTADKDSWCENFARILVLIRLTSKTVNNSLYKRRPLRSIDTILLFNVASLSLISWPFFAYRCLPVICGNLIVDLVLFISALSILRSFSVTNVLTISVYLI